VLSQLNAARANNGFDRQFAKLQERKLLALERNDALPVCLGNIASVVFQLNDLETATTYSTKAAT
jgi:hypothetical protein